MRQELQTAYQLAQATAARMNQSKKEKYKQNVCYHGLNSVEKVLIQNPVLKGKQKLNNRWSDNHNVVESQLSNIPVYHLRPIEGKGPISDTSKSYPTFSAGGPVALSC